jgi:hypothetical protein
MVMHTTAQTVIRELDRRTSDGFDVRLMWNSQTDRVFVTVEDERHGDSFSLAVDAAEALKAFHHPFAYTSNHNDDRSQPIERSPASPLRGEEER